MSDGLALLGVGVVAATAAGVAVCGGWFVARSLTEGRVLDRRMVRQAPEPELPDDSGPQVTVVEEPKNAVEAMIDRHAPWLRRQLAAAASPFTPVQVAFGSLIMTLSLFAVFSLLRLMLPIAFAAAVWAGVCGPLLLISWLAQRRRTLFLSQMPQTVDLIARSLQAGHPVTTAMSVAAHQMPDPIGPEFGKALAEISYGGDRDAALRNMLQRFPLPELQMFAASLEVTRETGGNVAEVLLKLGDTMRSKEQLRKKVEAISAEGKMSFWVISALPVIVVGALLTLQPTFYSDVMHDPLFWPLMTGPPTLLVIGSVTIWRMIKIKV